MATPKDPNPAQQPDHSMQEEEPLGWDQAPADGVPEGEHRHPRQEGTGGTPDEELSLAEAQGKDDEEDREDQN